MRLAPVPATSPPPKAATTSKKKLSYRQQRELEALPDQIEALEAEQERLTMALSGPDLYQKDSTGAEEINRSLHEVSRKLDDLMERWAELEG